MTQYQTKCPNCQKTFETIREFTIGSKKVHLGQCGHIVSADVIEKSDPSGIKSLDGKSLFPFQVTGARFAVQSGPRCLIADEMGLGKTPQALATIHSTDAFPALIICKSGLKVQWQKEAYRWLGSDYVFQILDGSSDFAIPGFKGYIVSFDMLNRLMETNVTRIGHCACGQKFPIKVKKISKRAKLEARERAFDSACPVCERVNCPTEEDSNELENLVARLKIKCIIIDECQQIKNTESKRAVALRKIARKVEHCIALSGTPIKNNAAEYFSILNILRPDLFPKKEQFEFNWCESYFDGYRYRTGGLRNPEKFAERTKDFIIRRERADVMPDLPSITRNFRFCDFEDGGTLEQQYEQKLEEFESYYDADHSSETAFEQSSNILAMLSKLRHLTGLMKIDSCVDFVMEFLGSTNRKIVIFVHHKDVAFILKSKLDSLPKELDLSESLQLSADLDGDGRAQIVEEFQKDSNRIMIASTLASGEGLNLQFCSDCIVLERQWNPANEEQAEARFIRIGQIASAVTATYFVAFQTVDEFFSEIVERKREIVNKTLGGKSANWDQSSLITELTEMLLVKGRKKWAI